MPAQKIDKPGMSAQEAAAINAAAVTRNYSVRPRLQYQTISAVSGMHQENFLIDPRSLDHSR
jgi:hypothetical protein